MEVLQPLPPPDFALPIIADFLLADDVVEYINFRAVCRKWRLCTASPTGLDSCFRPRNWIMLSDGDANLYSASHRRFLNLFTGRSLLLHLPELDSHYLHSDSGGLLVLIDKVTQLFSIFNPFTRHLVDLLPFLNDRGDPISIRFEMPYMINTFSTFISSGSCPTIALFSTWCRILFFTKPGDSWRFVTVKRSNTSMLFVKDRCYFADQVEGIKYVELDRMSSMLSTTLIPSPHRGSKWQCYHEIKDDMFDVFKVDLESNKLVSFNNARDLSIFLGNRGQCLVLCSKCLPSIKGNSIYFCTGLLRNPIIVYDFDGGEREFISVDAALHDNFKRINTSVRPFTLAHHLVTYCDQLTWSVGLMYHEFVDLPNGWVSLDAQMDDVIRNYSQF